MEASEDLAQSRLTAQKSTFINNHCSMALKAGLK
jgi:hypothetical protein